MSPEQFVVEGRNDHTGIARFVVNAYPGWHASANGAGAPIVKSLEGYITVPVPAGEVSIGLEYAVPPIGWRARLVGGGAILLLAVALLPPLGTRRATADAATAGLPFGEDEEGERRVAGRRDRSGAGFEVGADEPPLPGGHAGTIDGRGRVPGGPAPGPPQPAARLPSRR